MLKRKVTFTEMFALKEQVLTTLLSTQDGDYV